MGQSREKELVDNSKRLIRHIQDQMRKRQYLNAAYAATELTQKLLSAYGSVLHGGE